MADNVPPGEVNLYNHMPQLKKDVYNQRSRCCWAIAIGTCISYTYKLEWGEEIVEDFEVSPQDLIDGVWFYSSDEEKRMYEYDQWGVYFCGDARAYEYVRTKGVRLLKDCPFLDRRSDDIQPIRKNEHRIYCAQYEELSLEQAVEKVQNFKPVTARVKVTADFTTYKEGVYERPNPPEIEILGRHTVLIVGINVAEKYFVIRNSWGVKWGKEGYGLIRFNSIGRFAYTPMAWMEEFARVD